MTTHSDDHRWQVCIGCRKNRQMAPGRPVLGPHRREDPADGQMKACPGVNRPPAPPIVLDLQQRAAAEAAQIRGNR